MTIKLKVLKGENENKVFELKQEKVSIGRSADNEVSISDDKISRKHAVITKRKHEYIIEDLMSKNGTFLNGKLIEKAKLNDGDEIVIGDTVLSISVSGGKAKQKEREVDLTRYIKLIPTEGGLSKAETSISVDMSHRYVLDPELVYKDYETLKKAHESLVTLYKVNSVIASITDLNTLLEKILDLIFEEIKADRGFVMLIDEETGDLQPWVVRKRDKSERLDEITVSKTIIKEVVDGKKAVLTVNAMTDERFKKGESIFLHRIGSAMVVPLKGKEKILGIIHVDVKEEAGRFTNDDLQLLTAIATEAGISIENAKLYHELKDLFLSSIKTLVAAIEAKDKYTAQHSKRVADFSLAVAEELGLNREEKENVQLAALLHDIGKIGVDKEVLVKKGKLTEKEYKGIKRHPVLSAEIIEHMKSLHEIIPGVKYHQERYDGKGYPEGLKGEQIPIAARIVAVADVFDAITSKRTYAKKESDEAALKEVKEGAGTIFDSEVTDAFIRAYEKGRIESESGDNM